MYVTIIAFCSISTKFFLGSLIHPKVVRSVHFCPETKKVLERKYTDLTSLEAFPSSAVYPTKVISFVFLKIQLKVTYTTL